MDTYPQGLSYVSASPEPNSSNDTNELIPVLKKINEKYKIFPAKILADKWYGTEKNYNYWKKTK